MGGRDASAAPLGNPLLDGWREVFGDESLDWYERMYAAATSRDREEAAEEIVRRYTARSDLIAKYAFAVPTDEALDLIASYGPVVEIGAGTGYWARLLRDRGVDVVAYDNFGEAWSKWFPHRKTYTRVERGGPRLAGEHPDRTLLLVWPPYSSPMAVRALGTYERAGGRRLIYVGEGEGGCTASCAFFARVQHSSCTEDIDGHVHDPPTWQEVKSIVIPQWEGIHDYLWVYERKED